MGAGLHALRANPMTTQAPTPSKVDAPYDIELVELGDRAKDDDGCRWDESGATHTIRHGGCFAYACDRHAANARKNIRARLEGTCGPLTCNVCHDRDISPTAIEVVAL